MGSEMCIRDRYEQRLIAARLEPTALHQQITIEIAAEMGEEHLPFQQGFRAAQRWWPQGRQAVGGAAGCQLVPPHLFGPVLIASHQGDTPAISKGDDAGDGWPDPTDRRPRPRSRLQLNLLTSRHGPCCN